MAATITAAQATWLGAVQAGLLWFGLYEFSGRTSISLIAGGGGATKREQAAAQQSYASIPPIVFGLVWTVLYVLNTLATFFYWRDFSASSLYWGVFGLLIANVFFNKAWSMLFADSRRPRLAFADILVNIVVAVVLEILLAIDGAWLSFGLFIPYVLWLIVAAFLNWNFIKALNGLAKARAPGPQYGPPPSLRK